MREPSSTPFKRHISQFWETEFCGQRLAGASSRFPGANKRKLERRLPSAAASPWNSADFLKRGNQSRLAGLDGGAEGIVRREIGKE
jgi:hypothetical protein